MALSIHARIIIGIMLITVPTVEYGGYFLLSRLKKQSGYNEDGAQGHYFRAGHAHAGVLLILGMLAQLFVDTTHFADVLAYAVRVCFLVPPILMPIGFFIGAPGADGKPKPIIRLVPIGAIFLAVGAVVLGVGLLFGL